MPTVQIRAASEPVKLWLNGRGGPQGSLTVHGHWKKKLLLSWEDTWSVASRARGSASACPTLDMSLYEISTMSNKWTFLCNIESFSKVTPWVSFEPYGSVFYVVLPMFVSVAAIQFGLKVRIRNTFQLQQSTFWHCSLRAGRLCIWFLLRSFLCGVFLNVNPSVGEIVTHTGIND